MKIKTLVAKRRDGAFPKLELGDRHHFNVYEADENGVYDVPNDDAQRLINTGNFVDVAGKMKPKIEHVIVNTDGESVDLEKKTKAELVAFAKDEFDADLDEGKKKDDLIEDILNLIQAAKEAAE